ncbi:MAG: NAD(P)H-dependent oxidoreductase [Clostridiales bacterium]|nr:NAD(P)H-dependent oxidoreductase [Clostridiales bacterium]
MSKKILVAYFSCGGETAMAAKQLAQAAGADLFAIKPVVPYTEADLDWNDKNSRTSVEMRTLEEPAIADRVENMDSYDVVFVGFPIWWYIAPTIINGFLKSYDFSGKTLVPFATSGSSELGKTEAVLQAKTSPETNWLPGKRITSDMSLTDMKKWLKELKVI